MKLRLRGVIRRDLEWNEFATPNVGDLVQVDDKWYIALDRMWGAATSQGEVIGWDLGIILGPHAGPNKEAWVE